MKRVFGDADSNLKLRPPSFPIGRRADENQSEVSVWISDGNSFTGNFLEGFLEDPSLPSCSYLVFF